MDGANLKNEFVDIISEDISFVNTPTVVAVHIGESTLLPCVAMGEPQPSLSWRFKRQKIPVGESKCRLPVICNPGNGKERNTVEPPGKRCCKHYGLLYYIYKCIVYGVYDVISFCTTIHYIL